MKKILALMLVLLVCFTAFVACDDTTTPPPADDGSNTTEKTDAEVYAEAVTEAEKFFSADEAPEQFGINFDMTMKASVGEISFEMKANYYIAKNGDNKTTKMTSSGIAEASVTAIKQGSGYVVYESRKDYMNDTEENFKITLNPSEYADFNASSDGPDTTMNESGTPVFKADDFTTVSYSKDANGLMITCKGLKNENATAFDFIASLLDAEKNSIDKNSVEYTALVKDGKITKVTYKATATEKDGEATMSTTGELALDFLYTVDPITAPADWDDANDLEFTYQEYIDYFSENLE